VTLPPQSNDDPGWFSARTILWALVPGIGLRRAQADGTASVLFTLRAVFTSFVTALIMFGVVLLFIGGSSESEPSGPSTSVVAAGVLAYGLISLVLPRLIERPLSCEGEAALVSGYRTRFFLRVAFAEAAALLGFVGVFLSGETWMYPLGAAFTAVGFLRLAPTRRNLERDQEALNLAGCGLSLTTVLATAVNVPSR
jgi:F0F1-type ATP synthase membrane subunit c/vacuolar-type H+-ATPase subunit K